MHILKFLKELYLTFYVVFYRLGVSWSRANDESKGAVGVALVETALILSLWSSLDVLTGRATLTNIPKIAAVICFFGICAVNYNILVTKRHGIDFERQFVHLPSARKSLLFSCCVTVIIASVAFFIYTAIIHRRLINHG